MAKQSTVEASTSGPLEARFGAEQPYTLKIELRGTTPFLFNRFRDLAAYAEDGPGSKKKPREKALHDYEAMVQRDEGGMLAAPTEMVLAAMAAAGKYFTSPLAGRGSATTSLREGIIPGTPEPSYATFGVKEWDCVDFRLARNGDIKRSPKPTWRPRLEKGWLLKGAISVVTPEIYSPTRIMEVLTRAGVTSGLGDGRKLGFGRFVLAGHEIEDGLPW